MKARSRAARRLVLLFVAGCVTASADPALSQSNPGTQVFSVMSANLTSGSFSRYEAPGIRILQGLAPDVVLVQEFNADGSLRDLVDGAFGPEFHYAVEPGGESLPNGIVSRYPILSAGEWTDPEVANRDFAWAVIDLPGDVDLQVVSVHLASGASEAGTRNSQALALAAHVQGSFDPDHYIVVGGTLNVESTAEAAMDTFRTFLAVDAHVPVDPVGDRDTNEARNRPFDWVMPNALLDAAHTSLAVGGDLFPTGLVFDSFVFPAPLPSPILSGDSHVVGMAHMPVMKAFEATIPLSVPALGPVGLGLLSSLVGGTAYRWLRPRKGR